MKISKFTFFLLSFLFTVLVRANPVEIPEQHFRIDAVKKIIVTNYNLELINANQSETTSIILDRKYDFVQSDQVVQLGKGYQIVDEESNLYTLYFTELPIVSINTDADIVDTPKVHAQFKLIESDKEEISSDIGIEFRGASSQMYPKKSLEIEFWTSTDGSSTNDLPILGLMSDDSFNLQAMYNEDSRIRSKSANELWRQMSSLSYQAEEPAAKNGIDIRYVEVFLNDQYFGLYALSEKVNRKNLKLKKYSTGIRGELYKGEDHIGPNLYSYEPQYNNATDVWSNFEYKHPKGQIDWANLHSFVSFVVDADQSTFTSQIGTKFEIENAVDYFIFLNVTRAVDNTGKNIYIAKYDSNGKYFYVPWDLDSTFGYSWDSTVLDDHTGILTNGMYDKLLNDDAQGGFKSKVKQRWNELRNSALSLDNLYAVLDFNTNQLLRNNIYERENLAWEESGPTDSQDYMKDWLQRRVTYLDELFAAYLAAGTPKSNSEISYYPTQVKNELNINLKNAQPMQVQIYSALGQLVHSESTHLKENKINVSKLMSGIYFVTCKTPSTSTRFKIVVAH